MELLTKGRKEDLAALGEHADWATKTLTFKENGKDKEHAPHINWLAQAVKKEPLQEHHKQALEHFASYYDHHSKIKQADLAGKGLSEGIEHLRSLEGGGFEKGSGTGIVPKLGKTIIDYGDMEWRNIGKAGSQDHANTCKHCGNMPSMRNPDRKHERGIVLENKINDTTNKNQLFFVNNKGYITEAKAIGNRKPSEKYHKHILDLFEKPEVKGFVGGGYLSESNFHPDDIMSGKDEGLKQRLKELERKKPGFFSPDVSQLHESVRSDPGLSLEVSDKEKYAGGVQGAIDPENPNLHQIPDIEQHLPHLIQKEPYRIAQNPNLHQIPGIEQHLPHLIQKAPHYIADNPNLHQIPGIEKHLPRLIQEVPSFIAHNPNLYQIPGTQQHLPQLIQKYPMAIAHNPNLYQIPGTQQHLPQLIQKYPMAIADNPNLHQIPNIKQHLPHLIQKAPKAIANNPNLHLIPNIEQHLPHLIQEAPGPIAQNPNLHQIPNIEQHLPHLIQNNSYEIAHNPNLHQIPGIQQHIPHLIQEAPHVIALSPNLHLIPGIQQHLPHLIQEAPYHIASNPNLHLIPGIEQHLLHLIQKQPLEIAQNPNFEKFPENSKAEVKKILKDRVRAANAEAEKEERGEEYDDEIINEGQMALSAQQALYKNSTIHKLKDPKTPIEFIKKYEFSHNEEVGEVAQEALKKRLQKSQQLKKSLSRLAKSIKTTKPNKIEIVHPFTLGALIADGHGNNTALLHAHMMAFDKKAMMSDDKETRKYCRAMATEIHNHINKPTQQKPLNKQLALKKADVHDGHFPRIDVDRPEQEDEYEGSYDLPGGKFHHIFHDRGDFTHVLSSSEDPFDHHNYLAKIRGERLGDGIQINSSAAKEMGRGHGKELYGSVLAHHGEITSDVSLSPGSHKVYTDYLSQLPGVEAEITNDPYLPHTVTVKDYKQLESHIWPKNENTALKKSPTQGNMISNANAQMDKPITSAIGAAASAVSDFFSSSNKAPQPQSQPQIQGAGGGMAAAANSIRGAFGKSESEVSENLEKRSKNVRNQTRNITKEQALARRLRYALKLGLKPVDRNAIETPQNYESYKGFPSQEGNKITYGNAFPVEHETGHAMMTPKGSNIKEYTRQLSDDEASPSAKDAENVTNRLENLIDRRAGVGVGKKGDKAAHANPMRSIIQTPAGSEKLVDGKVVNPIKDEYTKKLNIPEGKTEYTISDREAKKALRDTFQKIAQFHMNKFDQGAKFNEQGEVVEPSGIDAKINNKDLQKRCWEGYEEVPGKKPYSKGSCRPKKK